MALITHFCPCGCCMDVEESIGKMVSAMEGLFLSRLMEHPSGKECRAGCEQDLSTINNSSMTKYFVSSRKILNML